MTLNITVMTRDVVYQSADFRLVDLSTGDPCDYDSRKIVHLQYENWQGFLTYAGIGSWDRKDTSEWVTDWLEGKSELTPHEAAQVIAGKMRQELKRFHSKQLHTFVLVAFDNGTPLTVVASNFEDAFGTISPVKDQLTISQRGMRKSEKSLLFVTGISASVTESRARCFETTSAKASRRGDEVSSASRSGKSRGVSNTCRSRSNQRRLCCLHPKE